MWKLMLGAATALFVTACGEPAPPVLIEPTQVDTLLKYGNTLDGQRISIDGYIHVDDGPDGQGGAAMAYTLTSRPQGLGDDLILFKAELGKDANMVDFPVLSTETMAGFPGAPDTLLVDLKNGRFQDGAGVSHSVQDKARITGRLASGSAREASRSPSGQSYRPLLTDVTLEAAP